MALSVHTLHSPKSPCRNKVLSTAEQLNYRRRAWVALGSSEGISDWSDHCLLKTGRPASGGGWKMMDMKWPEKEQTYIYIYCMSTHGFLPLPHFFFKAFPTLECLSWKWSCSQIFYFATGKRGKYMTEWWVLQQKEQGHMGALVKATYSLPGVTSQGGSPTQTQEGDPGVPTTSWSSISHCPWGLPNPASDSLSLPPPQALDPCWGSPMCTGHRHTPTLALSPGHPWEWSYRVASS